ncbi:hypothetical protein BGW42_001455 [Actinomortierella wolfii]|nr:hypothetical protein BGW42_001455 [Actinomortierella wolfii]
MEATEAAKRESKSSRVSEDQAVADHRKIGDGRRPSLDKGKAKAMEGLAKQDKTPKEEALAQTLATGSGTDANKIMPGGFPGDEHFAFSANTSTVNDTTSSSTDSVAVEAEQDASKSATTHQTTLSPKAGPAERTTENTLTVPVTKSRPSLLDDDDSIPLASISAQPEAATAMETVDWQKTTFDVNDQSLVSTSEKTERDEAPKSDTGKGNQIKSLIDFDGPSTELEHIPILSLTDRNSWTSLSQNQPPKSITEATPTTSSTNIPKGSSVSTGSADGKNELIDPTAFNDKVWDNFDGRNTFFDFSVKPDYDISDEEGGHEDGATTQPDTFAEAQSRAQSIQLYQTTSASQGGDQVIGRFAPAVRSQPKDTRKVPTITVEPKDPGLLLAGRPLGTLSQSHSRKIPVQPNRSAEKPGSSAEESEPNYPSLDLARYAPRDQEKSDADVKKGSNLTLGSAATITSDEEDGVQQAKASGTGSGMESSSKGKVDTSASVSLGKESDSDPFDLNTPEAIAQREQRNREGLGKSTYGLSTSQDEVTSASPAGFTDTEGAYNSTGYDTDPRKPVPSTQRRKEQDELQQPRSPVTHVRHHWDDLPPIVSVTDSEFSHQDHRHSTDLFPSQSFGAAVPSRESAAAASQEPPRTKLYPPAPLEPWGPPQPVQEPTVLRHRSSLAKSTQSIGPIRSDPSLTFQGSLRSSDKPASASARSAILGELPKTMLGENTTQGGGGAQTAKAQKTITLPANPKDAPVLRGRYELPSMKTIQNWNTANGLGPFAFRRLILNTGGLVFTSWVWRRAAIKTLAQKLVSSLGYDPLFWIGWAFTVVFLINIFDVLRRYSNASNKFEKLPLTPEQRLRLGLEPVESSVPGAVPVFQKSTSSTIDLLEVPLRSTYVAPSTQRSTSGKLHTQLGKPLTASTSSSMVWSKSMSKSVQQMPQVHTKSELQSLIKAVESREGAENEWRMAEAAAAEASKRAATFALGVSDRLGAPSPFGVGASGDAAGRKPDAGLGLSVSRYQPALRTTLSKDRTSKTELQKDGLPVWTPAKVLKTLKITEEQLDRWVLRMRKWLWTKVVSPMCDEMEAVDKAFEAAGFGYLDCKSATMFSTSAVVPQKNASEVSTANAAGAAGSTGTSNVPGAGSSSTTNPLAWGAATTTAPQLPSAFAAPAQPAMSPTPTSLKDLNDRWGNDEMVRRRMVLEAYLSVPGVSNRAYVVERIKAFGPLLNHFKWDSEGVRWDGGRKEWTPDLPTDSQILMHLFATFLDLAMPAQPMQGYGRFPFSYKHLVSVDGKPDLNVAIQIKQSSRNPPCYHLVVNGNVWEIVPKRMNIWYTLVLFIYVVMKESGGYLGQAHFGSRALGLDTVVEV